MYYIFYKPEIRDITNLKAIWNAYGMPARFVVFYTFALNYHFHQYDVFGYHLVNTIIHLATSLLVGWFLTLTLSTPQMKASTLVRHKHTLAFFAALLFLTHPIQTQAVTYVCQRFASLATMFYLMSICFYIKGRLMNGLWVSRAIFFVMAGTAGVLGMFSKQITITLPIMIVLYEICFLRGKEEGRQPSKQLFWVLAIIALAFMLIIPAMYSFNFSGNLNMAVESGSHKGDYLTNRSYLLTQFHVIVTYIRLLFLPINQNLLYNYPASKGLLTAPTLLCFLFLLAVFLMAVKLYRRHRLIAFGIFWFFIALSVESSIIVIKHVIFEHRLYLPSVGFGMVVTVGFYTFVKDYKKFCIIFSAIIFIMSFLTFQRNKVWQDELSLWSDVAKKSPDLARPYVSLGAAYLEKDFEKAVQNFNKAIAIDPSQIKAYNNRGLLYNKNNFLDLALADFNKGIELEPGRAELYNNRADVYEKRGRYDLALRDYNKTIQINPTYAEAYVNRGVLYGKKRSFDLSVADFTTAIKLHPSLAPAYNNRAVVYNELDHFDLAKNDLDHAILFQKNYADAYYNRGNAYRGLKEYAVAIADYGKALNLKPDYAEALNNRGIVYGIIGRADLAFKDFEQAIKSDPDYSAAYYNRSLVFKNRGEAQKALNDVLKAKSLGKIISPNYIQELENLLKEVP